MGGYLNEFDLNGAVKICSNHSLLANNTKLYSAARVAMTSVEHKRKQP